MLKFRLFTLPLIAFVTAAISAPKGPWLLDINANVTLPQNAYSESWIGSEKGALSWASKLDAVAERQFASWFNHRNTLKLAFGQTRTQNDDNSWGDFAKSTDLIDFESLQRFTMSKQIEPFIALRIISQFSDERDSTTTHYINPTDIFESFGVARSLVTSDAIKWNARLGGAVHQSIDRYFFDPATNERTAKTVNDAGAELVTEVKATMRDGLLDYSGLLTVFEALVSSDDEKDVADATPLWRYPDINWENILSVNITKYVMINLTVQLLYDREKHVNARIKEVLAAGLTYKFNNAKKEEKK